MADLSWNRLHYLPLPEGGELTPADAREWLTTWAPEWVTILAHGASDIRDQRVREDYGMLACDVRTMLEAAVAAVLGEESIRLEREAGCDTPASMLAAVARIVASKEDAFGGNTGAFEACYQQLADDLSRRLEQLGEHRAGEGQA